MRRIIKDDTPVFWSEFCELNPKIVYDDLEKSSEGRELRSNIRKQMINVQKGVCCYCCKSIEAEDTHNEHIKPRNSFPQYSMDYNNLIVSCNSKNSCGIKKDKYYDAKFISPLEEDCESHFKYLANGVIEGVDERGKYTIDILNLNSHKLVSFRKNIYDSCVAIAGTEGGKEIIIQTYIRESDGKLPSFSVMVEYFLKKEVFDYIEENI